MKQSKTYYALLLILGISATLAAPSSAIGADSTNSGSVASDKKESSKNGKESTSAPVPTPDKGTEEKKGSGGSEPECN